MRISRDKADDHFSKYVRLRDGKCMRCGSLVRFNDKGDPVSHEASHFQSRRKEATRFDLLNVDTMCSGCHSYLGGNPYEHVQWQVAKKGQKEVDLIILRSNQHFRKDRKMAEMVWKQAYLDLKASKY